MTIPQIRTKLQMFSHLNNSQNKVLCDWKDVEITINWKWVAVYNETDVISLYVYKWSFFPLTLLNVSSFTSNSYIVQLIQFE